MGDHRGVIEAYIEHRSPRLLPATRTSYRRDLHLFADFLGGEERLPFAAAEDVSEWIHRNTRDPKDPEDARPWDRATARRKRSALSGFYRWLKERGERPDVPTDGIELPPKHIWRPMRVAAQDIRRILATMDRLATEASPKRAPLHLLDLCVCSFAFYLGLRVSEAVSIRLSSFHSLAGELRLRLVKKGDQVAEYPVTGQVHAAYGLWLEIRATITPAPGHEDNFFIHPWHGRRISVRRMWYRLRGAAREAGLDEELIQHLSMHKLRHAIAYHLVETDVDLPAIQAFLGHTSLATTDHYVRADEARRMDLLRQTSRDPALRD